MKGSLTRADALSSTFMSGIASGRFSPVALSTSTVVRTVRSSPSQLPTESTTSGFSSP